MAQQLKLLNAQTGTGAGPAVALPAELFRRSVTIDLAGVGVFSASVRIQVSNNGGQTWATRMTFSSISGTATALVPITDTDVDNNAPYPLVRAYVDSISGGALSVDMTAVGV